MAEYIFICYTHEDTRFVLKLAKHLQRHGVSVWLDQWQTNLEDDWERAIARAINRCSHFLVVLSPAAVNSWLVCEQTLQAARQGKPVITVLRDVCPCPSILQDAPCFNLSGQSYRPGLQQLLNHFFPNRAIQLAYWPNLKPVWRRAQDKLNRFWRNTLGPLLWPGWLGPVVIAAPVLLALIFWTRSVDGPVTANPTPESLAIVRPAPTPAPLPTPQQTAVRAPDRKVMVFVPAGEFLMGSSDSDATAADDEKPQHPIHLDAFWIDQTEITYNEYERCVRAGACSPATVHNKNFAGARLPVVGVNWYQAATYCQWAGARLPTEAEWEKAARGTDGRLYPWGNNFDGRRLNYCDTNCVADWRDRSADDGYGYTAPVGNYPEGASPYGVLDMSGNVWEWTADWYSPDAYAYSSYSNPGGPKQGLQRVIRGGSWYYRGPALRVARRHKDVPTSSYDNIGFRCVIADKQVQRHPAGPPGRFGGPGVK